MRHLLTLSLLVAAGILSTQPALAKAKGGEQISQQGAKNICRHHHPDASGSCMWCGKQSCAAVTCGHTCSVVVVKLFQPHRPGTPGRPMRPVHTVSHSPVLIGARNHPPMGAGPNGNSFQTGGASFNHSGRHH